MANFSASVWCENFSQQQSATDVKPHADGQTLAITGITGQVGGVVATTLLAAGQTVRAVVRSADKGKIWAAQGCAVAVAEMSDARALAAAFAGADGVFILLPPNFAPSTGFPEAVTIVAALRTALEDAHPGKIVCLSTIGAQASQPNLLTQLQIMEQALRRLSMPMAFLRAAWFMENAASDVEPAVRTGVVQSFLQPLDKPFPMVATADAGRVAAELLQQSWSGRKVVELEGPHRITPNEIAATFSKVLGRGVKTQAVPREKWEALFRAQGVANPMPGMRMLDGLNEGWIEFEGGEAGVRKGTVPLETVLRDLVARQK
jgi:NAD(P)H dehydrogenase (quinone)